MQKDLQNYLNDKSEKNRNKILKHKEKMSFQCIVLVICPELKEYI
jgi:hypothetical protein